MSSLFKKYLMALSGLVLVGFVFFHMLGNLQMFQGPDAINGYAEFLEELPPAIFWGARGVLLLAAITHAWTATLLTRENRKARPQAYAKHAVVQAKPSSWTMGITGSVLLFFIIFHLLHFTTLTIYPEYGTFTTILNGEEVHDVYRMVIDGFSHDWIAVFYIVAMAILCKHLSHGVSSMFQSLGLRNTAWQPRFRAFAVLYGWVIFLGFISNPAAVLLSKYSIAHIFPL